MLSAQSTLCTNSRRHALVLLTHPITIMHVWKQPQKETCKQHVFLGMWHHVTMWLCKSSTEADFVTSHGTSKDWSVCSVTSLENMGSESRAARNRRSSSDPQLWWGCQAASWQGWPAMFTCSHFTQNPFTAEMHIWTWTCIIYEWLILDVLS